MPLRNLALALSAAALVLSVAAVAPGAALQAPAAGSGDAATAPGTDAGVTAGSIGGVTAGSGGGVTTQSGAGSCAFPVTVTDATGTEVTVDAEPGRVVTLAPSAAQTMWEIGAREKVVGVSKYASYLEGAGRRTNVSVGGGGTSVETVVALGPDLVLAPNVVANDTVRALRRAGLTVYRFGAVRDVGAIAEQTRLTGRLVGRCEGAAATARRMEADLAQVERAVEGEPRPRVLYVFFGYTAGGGTFIDEVITLAGGRNVAAEAGIAGYRQISPETVLAEAPEWLVLNSDDPRVPDSPAYEDTTAVRRNQIVVVDADYVSQPAPRVIRTVRKLARTFHPEGYAAADANATAGTRSTTERRAPGFGVGLAAAALFGVALLAASLLARPDGE